MKWKIDDDGNMSLTLGDGNGGMMAHCQSKFAIYGADGGLTFSTASYKINTKRTEITETITDPAGNVSRTRIIPVPDLRTLA